MLGCSWSTLNALDRGHVATPGWLILAFLPSWWPLHSPEWSRAQFPVCETSQSALGAAHQALLCSTYKAPDAPLLCPPSPWHPQGSETTNLPFKPGDKPAHTPGGGCAARPNLCAVLSHPPSTSPPRAAAFCSASTFLLPLPFCGRCRNGKTLFPSKG